MLSAVNFDKILIISFWNEHMKVMTPMRWKYNVTWKRRQSFITKEYYRLIWLYNLLRVSAFYTLSLILKIALWETRENSHLHLGEENLRQRTKTESGRTVTRFTSRWPLPCQLYCMAAFIFVAFMNNKMSVLNETEMIRFDSKSVNKLFC